MGYADTLGVAVSTATVTATLSSPHSASRCSVEGVHGGHGFRPAAAKTNFERSVKDLASSSAPWRRELLLSRGRRKTNNGRLLASSSDEPSAEKGLVKTEDVPGWANPDSEELPPWAKNERPASQEPAQDVPFPVYLIGSTLVAIAAVGSVFEFFNKNPIFGVVTPDSPFYIPILGFFAITGVPTAGFLFYKSIQLANKASEEADKEDGFRR